mmetsp:Transcript_2135/g.4043  ORF Transcript_2135/g.4043 Transcript_2135/m.4043 type:complete len:239 (-) Transcript_2135:359-1075(-)
MSLDKLRRTAAETSTDGPPTDGKHPPLLLLRLPLPRLAPGAAPPAAAASPARVAADQDVEVASLESPGPEAAESPARADTLAAPPLPNPRSTSTPTTKDTGSTFHRNLPAAAAPRAAASQASPVEARAESPMEVEAARVARADTLEAAAARPLLLPAGMGQDGMGDGVDTADGAAALEDGRRPNGKLPHGMVDGPILLLPLLVPPHPARRPHHQAAVESLASQAVESLARAVDQGAPP